MHNIDITLSSLANESIAINEAPGFGAMKTRYAGERVQG